MYIAIIDPGIPESQINDKKVMNFYKVRNDKDVLG